MSSISISVKDRHDDQAFIFTLLKENQESFRKFTTKKPDKALCQHHDRGPCFGEDKDEPDLGLKKDHLDVESKLEDYTEVTEGGKPDHHYLAGKKDFHYASVEVFHMGE